MIEVRVEVPKDDGLFAWLKRQLTTSVQTRLREAVGRIRPWASARIRERLTASETYRSLKDGGVLSAELGLGPYQQTKVDQAVDHVANAVDVIITPASGDSLGGVRLRLLSGGLPELLARPFAAYVSAGRHGPTTVPWLEWLLTGGSEVLLSEWDIAYLRPGRAPSSRTGMAIMVRTRSGWSLPGSRGGTPGNNWVEDALGVVAGEAGEKLAKEIRGVVR